MAAFTHLNPEGSRFSDGTFGVIYVSAAIQTAIREAIFHRERFLRRTKEPPLQIQMRRYVTAVRRRLFDARGGFLALHDPDSYSGSQRFATEIRAAGADGIAYDSVRDRGGHCVVAFWPDCVAPFMQAAHYAYVWDGNSVTNVIELTQVAV